MLATALIDQLVMQVLDHTLPRRVAGVHSRTSVDPEGQGALMVKVVLRGDGQPEVTGEEALTSIYEVQQRLQTSGEDRFAYLEFRPETEAAEEQRYGGLAT